MKLHKSKPAYLMVEIVTYDPEDSDTYPSVCHTADEVKDRFGFVGGERLLFTVRGRYIGKLAKTLPGGENDSSDPRLSAP